MQTTHSVRHWLRVAGAITWSVIGVTFAVFFLDVPAQLGSGRTALWALAYATFLVTFWCATGPAAQLRPPRFLLLLLALQSLSAFLIAGLPSKPVGFIFLTLVAAQMPGLLPVPATIAWIVLQTAVMGGIYAVIVPAWEAQAYVAVYLAFQAFAFLVVRAAWAEASARAALAVSHAALRQKDAELAESRRIAERVRIGRDLHDVLGHHLTAMCLNLEVATHLTTGTARDHVERAGALARTLLDDVRDVVTELRVEAPEDLEPTLLALAAELPRPRIHIRVDAALRGAITPQKGAVLVHSARELMTNAARHSRAENLWLSVTRGTDGITLEARDDGTGSALVHPGTGLAGVEARFAALGGTIAVTTAEQRGFTLRGWLP